MKHIFQKGTDQSKPTFVLLHGTGGTEHDLLPIAEKIDPEVNILSVRGNVLENGMPRFFKRLAEGVFDEEDLVFRKKELYEFLEKAAEKYGFNRDRKSTRLNSSHVAISYAVFCLKKKKRR